jgi:acetyltransferase
MWRPAFTTITGFTRAAVDAVYAAAFRRAGLLRVFDLDELFAAAETLGRLSPFGGKRLAIMTNCGGIGVLAVDRVVDLGATLAGLSPQTLAKLDSALPPTWSKSNPIDIIGDADATRYATALQALLDDTENDAVLAINVPTALASSSDCADAVVRVVQQERAKRAAYKPVLTVWVGDDGRPAKAFDDAAIPDYGNETDAIRGFMHLVRYVEAKRDLMETPPSVPTEFVSDTETARQVLAEALAAGKIWLDPLDVNRLFNAYGIFVSPGIFARDGKEAVAAARPFLQQGQSVVVKVFSPDIIHKSDVDGVRLNLTSEKAVEGETEDILKRAHAARPAARLSGVTVHPMIVRPKARELIIGLADDPTFGPIIVFGSGGTAVEVVDDKALSLPPLDLKLAGHLIDRTRVSRLLRGYRNVPPADRQALELMLVKVTQLAADLPEVREIDLNPVLADEKGVIVVDARVAIAPVEKRARAQSRFAIRPYPKEWERHYATMLRMCGELGFKVEPDPDDPGLCHVVLDLSALKPLMRASGLVK